MDPQDSGSDVNGTENTGDAVVEEVTTTETTVTDPGDNPSTPAQDVVDEVHETQADNSTAVEETTTTKTTVSSPPVEAGADEAPPAEGTGPDDRRDD